MPHAQNYFYLHAIFIVLLLFIQPVFAVEPQSQRNILTLELLEERINSPIVNQGSLTIDLRDMEIDLQSGNQEFSDNFYRLLRDELQKNGTKPVGLDLSNSIIEGDFIGSDLGLRTPLDEKTFTHLASRFVVTETLTPGKWLLQIWQCLGLCLLLLLSGNGTNFYLVFGVGIIAIATFSVIFWLVDRFRRVHPNQIIPTLYETISILGSFFISILFGLIAIFRNTLQPLLTLACLIIIIVP